MRKIFVLLVLAIAMTPTALLAQQQGQGQISVISQNILAITLPADIQPKVEIIKVGESSKKSPGNSVLVATFMIEVATGKEIKGVAQVEIIKVIIIDYDKSKDYQLRKNERKVIKFFNKEEKKKLDENHKIALDSYFKKTYILTDEKYYPREEEKDTGSNEPVSQ